MADPTARQLGPLLRHHRRAAGLSQAELAERAGLSTAGVRALESGRRASPRPFTVRALADALALPETERTALFAAAVAEPALVDAALADAAPPASTGDDRDAWTPLPPPPLPPTRLVGREQEVAGVVVVLRSGRTRLVTLTGPGGVGKTRLATAVAREVGADYDDGVAWIDLAPMTGPPAAAADVVAGAIARALGVREVGAAARPWPAAATAAIGGRAVLLILDNFEHLLAAAPWVADLLTTCPRLAVLATSRARLHLRGEHELAVRPLEVPAPAPGPVAPTAGLAGVAAVRLFVERAAAVRGTFALTAENAVAVAEICRRLDGLPLAIELAAGWAKIFSPTVLLERLEPSLPLLVGGAHDLPDRQRTMRDAIAWSHDLLDPSERAFFRRLAVFAGGFTLEAAEWVAGDGLWVMGERDDGTDPQPATLDLLASLVDKSLVRPLATEAAGDARFGMLETIREYARERLLAAGEGDEIGCRHAEWFLAFAERHAVSHHDPRLEPGLTRLDAEWENLRAAFAWFAAAGQDGAALRLAASLFPYCTYRSRCGQVGDWLERSLAAAVDPSVAVLSRGLTGLAAIRMGQGKAALAVAERVAAAGLALVPRLAPLEAHGAFMAAGCVAVRRGDDRRAAPLFEEALAVAAAFPDPSHAATAQADAYAFLGEIAHAEGRFDEAEALLERSLALSRQGGDPAGETVALRHLGDLDRDRGLPDRALGWYRQSLVGALRLRDAPEAAYALAGVACVAAAAGWHLLAAQLDGKARQILAQVGIGDLLPTDAEASRRAMAACRAALGPDRFAAAERDGRAMGESELVAAVAAVGD